jgi:hypothetical protein
MLLHFPVIVLPFTGSMRRSTPQAEFRSGSDARDDLSLARNGYRFHGLHSGVNVPGLPLRSLPVVLAARSVYRSITSSGLLPVPATSTR